MSNAIKIYFTVDTLFLAIVGHPGTPCIQKIHTLYSTVVNTAEIILLICHFGLCHEHLKHHSFFLIRVHLVLM